MESVSIMRYYGMGPTVGARSAVGFEGELAHAILDTFCLELLFSGSNPCDFRVCVNHGRNHIVVDMPSTA